MILLKYLGILGAFSSFVGTILVGFVAQGGIPRKGQMIKAPNYTNSVIGWGLIALGFLLALIKELLS